MPCFQLSPGSVCGNSFAGVFISSTQFGFTNEDGFNKYIKAQVNPTAMAGFFGCPAATDLDGLQYQLSYACSSAAATSVCPAAQAQPINVGLCLSQCDQIGSSMKAIMTAQCNTDLLAKAVPMIQNQCSESVKAGGNVACWPGVQSDVQNCGFFDSHVGCSRPENAALSCCQNGDGKAKGGDQKNAGKGPK
ncbi:hypothetical protein HDU98_007576 [Podochytrium sp. JEL0797]|nr:hypothetical protein HDU98_007576 [Podochytrium sp. JEL0797]